MGIFYGKKCNSVSLGVISGKKFIGVLLGVISGEKNVMVSHCWPKNGKENIVLWLWYYSQPISPFSHLGLCHNIKFPLWLCWYSKLFLLHSFFIRTKFIRTPSLRFGEILRTFWMLNLTRFFNCSYVEILRLKFPFSTKNAFFLWL